MNLLILVTTLLLSPVHNADTNSIYQLQFNGLDSNIIDMSSYKGKHIVVYEFDAAYPDKEQMIALDSLYKNNNNIIVIAVPANDLDSTEVTTNNLRILLKDSLQISYPVADISLAKKTASIHQHPLLDWVTHLEKNGHFDDDIIEQGYMFIISDTGILYSIIKEKISMTSSTLQEVLTNEPLE